MTCWAGNASARRLSWRARLGDRDPSDGWWIIGSKVGSKDKPSPETMVVTYPNTENIEEPCRF